MKLIAVNTMLLSIKSRNKTKTTFVGLSMIENDDSAEDRFRNYDIHITQLK